MSLKSMRLLLPSYFLQSNTGIVKITSFSTTAASACRWRRRSQARLDYELLRRNNRWDISLHCRISKDRRSLYHASKTISKATQKLPTRLTVTEFPASTRDASDGGEDRQGIIYISRRSNDDTETSGHGDNNVWDTTNTSTKDEHGDDSFLVTQLQTIPKKVISLLLPAQYPQSVAPGYLGFVSFCFTASVAGSAAMVLSTQTLLLAVGIVGQSSSGIMAGALNWVMKDFIGQLGGIVFASRMGKTKAFDSDPKRWRMVAALALDGATMMEILAPLCQQSLVLPVASIANIGKNVGYLTASASRAALHQSLAATGNLGDVTVKAGSQSMMASLVGTSFGIGLSTWLDHSTFNFGICFVCLSAIHQGCTYLSLQKVPLAHFNRHRLHLVLKEYIQTKRKGILTPAEVAKKEAFFPLFASDSTLAWLSIGRPLGKCCSTPNELETSLDLAPNEAYLIRFHAEKGSMDLVYFHDAKEEDLFRGMYHACLIRDHAKARQKMATGTVDAVSAASTTTSFDPKTLVLNTTNVPWEQEIIQQTHMQVQEDFPHLYEEIHKQGWNTSSEVTMVEDSHSNRISIDVI
mmetsp:Transcript_19229/g.41793  ORF Transcript_19229/g.41793 Transcript_19229/m.41793 type:complete len:578 (-) Transcript_19229:85-1818(-)